MIISAKVIGVGVSYETYSRQEPNVGRGSPLYIMSRGELTNFASNPKRWLDGYREDAALPDAWIRSWRLIMALTEIAVVATAPDRRDDAGVALGELLAAI